MDNNGNKITKRDNQLKQKSNKNYSDEVVLDYIKKSENILNGQKKIEYAKDTLGKELYEIIGKEYILDVWMTIAKIDTIPYSLSKEQILAIGIKNLVNKNMTNEKIEYIGNNMSIEDILDIGGEELINISIVKLILSEDKYNLIGKLLEKNNISTSKITNIEKKLTVEQIIVLGIENIIKEELDSYRITAIGKMTIEEIEKKLGNNLISIPLAQLLLQKDKYNALEIILTDVNLINPNCLNTINKRLSAEQILKIGGNKLLSMNNTAIIKYNSEQ